MVGRRPIIRRVRAARVVGDHPSQRRPRARGYVRTETKSLRPQKFVELIEDDAGADANGSSFEIEVRDEAEVARKINDHAFSDRATGEAGPRAPWKHGKPAGRCR